MTHPLDDAALSAHLDGEADAETAEHVAACEACRGRLAQLRAAAAVIGTPVSPVDDTKRRRAVAAALEPGGVVAQRRRRIPTWVAAAAAAVVIVLAAIPVIAFVRGGGEDVETAADARRDKATALTVAPDDLGPQSDPVALRNLLEQRMATPVPSAVQAPFEGTGGKAAGSGGRAASEQAGEAEATPPSTPECGPEAAVAGGGRVGEVLYIAFLRWQDTPAVVHVFRAPDPETSTLTRRAFVMARRDCRLLVAQSF